MREKDVPVDVIEMKVSEELVSLHWEPKGNKFSVISTENSNNLVCFYEVQQNTVGSSSTAGVKILKQIEAKGINVVKWSPKGKICVLAGIRGFTGDLQFWDVDDLTMMSSGEHYSCTDVEWDPTGRYVVSFVSAWHVQNDNGLMMWTLTGQELAKQNIIGLKQFVWRPRPATLLPLSAQKKIKKNLKNYSKEFDEEDAAQSNKASTEVQEKRKSQLMDYKAFIGKFDELKEKEKDARIKIFGFDPYARDEGFFEEMVEVVELIEEIVDEDE